MNLIERTITGCDDILDVIGLNRENSPVILHLVFGSVGLSVVLLATNGNFFSATAFLAVLAVGTITIYRLDWGLFIFIGSVLLFDQFHIPGFYPLTFRGRYFFNLKEIPYVPSMFQTVLNPLELHLLLLILVWFVRLGIKKECAPQRIPMWGPAALFFGALAAAFAYGMRQGGDSLVALWEVRALFYLGIMYMLVPQIIQTREQVSAFFWVCIATISFKAFQGIVRFAELGFSFRGMAILTNHEDPLFILSLIVLLVSLALLDAYRGQTRSLLWLLFPLVLGFFTGQRRAAYAAVVPTFVMLFGLLPKKQFRSLAKLLVPVVLVIAAYSAIFWNSTSKFASPVRLIKTTVSFDEETAGDRFYSNLYRKFERYDLAITVRNAPLQGVGFGNPYEQPIPLAAIPFPLRDYIPHNEILWLLVKMGGLGFFFFWFFFNAFVFEAASVSSRLQDPYLKAACAVPIVMVVAQMVVSYFDLQLTYYRNMVYLGSLMGLLPTLESVGCRAPSIARGVEL